MVVDARAYQITAAENGADLICLHALDLLLLLLGLLDEVLGDCLDYFRWVKLVEDLLSGYLLGL